MPNQTQTGTQTTRKRTNHPDHLFKQNSPAITLNRQRERASPLRDLLPQVIDLLNLTAGDLGLEVLQLVGLLGKRLLHLLGDLNGLVDVAGDALEVLLAETARAHGRCTESDTAGRKGRLVAWDGILVACDVHLLRDGLDAGAVQRLCTEVQQDHVAVRAVGDELIAEFLELFFQRLGVLDDLLLVESELGGLGLLQGNGEGGDGVVVWATLVAREDGEVDGSLEVIERLLAGLEVLLAHALAEEDHRASGTAQRLVGGGGDDVGVLKGGGDDAGGDQAGDVGHVDHEVGAAGIGNFAEAAIVDQTAVGGGADHDDLGAVHHGVGLELLVVDDAGLEVDAEGEGFEVCRDCRDSESRSQLVPAISI